MTLKVLSLFAGIGGWDLGLEKTGGFRTVRFCEINPAASDVLARHWPDIPCHDDVQTMEFAEGEADVITASFPCQDISSCGNRAGITGERSGLFREVVRAYRMVRSKFVLLENVADLIHRGLGTVLGELASSGLDAEWDCIPARAVGAPHGRDRIWVVAYPASGKWRTDARGGHDADGTHANGTQADRLLGTVSQQRHRGQVASAANADCQRRLQPGWCFAEIGRRLNDGPPPASGWETPWPEKLSQISRMDDGLSDRLDKAGIDQTGNAVVPQIPEIIGHAILAAYPEARLKSEAKRSDTGNADCRDACLTHIYTGGQA